MIMSKKKIIVLHVFTWLFAAFYNLRGFSMFADPEQLTMYLVSTLFLAIPFYLFYSLLVPRFLEKKKYTLFLVWSLIILNLLTFIGYSGLLSVKAYFSHDFHHFYGIYSVKMHLSGFSVMLTAATFGSFFKVMLNWLNTINQKEILEKEKAVSELALLKSKVNPHFLFNTLNNIDVLIYYDPDKASQSLLKLSDIMRYMSYETVSDFVSLSKEIDYIENIVSLYSLRVTNPELIKLDIPEHYPDLHIAPMLFIPFIENAFKYARMKEDHAGFEIRFRIEEKKVDFSVFNYYDPLEKPPVKNYGGTGIANVKRRLEHIYPGRYTLNISDKDGFFRVELTVDTDGD